MRVSTQLFVCAALGAAALAADRGFGQRIASAPRAAAPATDAVAAADAAGKFNFILFWKANDATTQKMTETLRRAVAERSSQAAWTPVNVRDPASRAIVERYQVQRAPMPLVLCIAPNGAITGAFARQINVAAVENSLVTPAMAEATKAMQDKKIVVVHVKADPQTPLPAGAVALIADPTFAGRVATVDVELGDPLESRFVSEMKINTADVKGSQLVVFAPPGVDVGKFPATATKDDLTTALHAAGKCCDDPNCKHKQKGQ
jgi:hypothetical protein